MNFEGQNHSFLILFLWVLPPLKRPDLFFASRTATPYWKVLPKWPWNWQQCPGSPMETSYEVVRCCTRLDLKMFIVSKWYLHLFDNVWIYPEKMYPNLWLQFNVGHFLSGWRSQEKRVKTIAFLILGGGIFRGCRSLKEVVAANLRGICAGAYEGWDRLGLPRCP